MKKVISIISLVGLVALAMPVMAQDTTPPAPTPTPTDCKGLKGKERAACQKAQKDAKKAEKKAGK